MKKIAIILGIMFFLSVSMVYALFGDGLQAYYQMNEISGNASDIYGSNTMLQIGSVGYSSGIISNSRGKFSSGNYFNRSTFTMFTNYSRIFSYSAWVNANSSISANFPVIESTIGSNPGDFIIRMIYVNTDKAFYCTIENVGNNGAQARYYINMTPGTWYYIVCVYNGTNKIDVYVNGVIGDPFLQTLGSGIRYPTATYIGYNPLAEGWFTFDGYIDEVGFWNRSLSPSEITQLYNSGLGLTYPFGDIFIYNVTCTSCNPPIGDSNPPYETDDTTPTFTFNTSSSAACRISDLNINYTTMGSSRDCNYGQSLLLHTCTLTAQDGLVNYNTSVYISCDYNITSSANLQLSMLISSLETPNSTEAIMQGIENSVVWPGATVYTNQKVYLRLLNNTQILKTVNKVVAYGNQRWLINYVNETGTQLGLFNITPVVYSLDMKNMTIKAIRANVTYFINSTKN